MAVTTSTDYDQLAATVAGSAPDAYILQRITAAADSDLHTIWLDPATVTIWHAWTEPGSDIWNLEDEPAEQALHWIEETLTLTLNALDDPETGYDLPPNLNRVSDDLETFDEFQTVQLAALRARADRALAHPVPDEPTSRAQLMDQMILAQMDHHRALIQRLSALRARSLQQEFGTERGAAAAAAAALGVSHEAARKALAASTSYDKKVLRAAQGALEAGT